MKNFWALPAFLRLAIAAPHAFSVFDDLLAFPQYEIDFPDTYITENAAFALLSQSKSQTPSSAPPNSQETQELSKPDKHAPPSTPDEIAPQEIYEAVVHEGRRYLCSIPIIPEEQPQNSTTTPEQAKAEEQKELMRAADRGWKLLEGMEENCIYYLSGWWSYSFCYNGEVKQFHQLPPSRGVPLYPPVEDPGVKSYILGRFPKKEKVAKKSGEAQKTLGGEESGKEENMDDEGNVQKPGNGKDGLGSDLARLETKGTARYMVQRLGGGTECDLTGKERKIEVQFHCHPANGDRIAMIKETSTCSYLMIIHTPRLCNDVAFLPPQENLAHKISCRAVIGESEVDSWTLEKLEGRITEAARLVAIATENPLRDITEGAEGNTKGGAVVGGIEVGAKKLVGSEGKVIEKSVVAGGGKETYLGTIATSSGFQMTKEEMKKLGISNPDEVEKMKNRLAKSAGKQKWKLDLVQTPGGREFRWIIGGDDDDEEETKGKETPADGSAKKGKGAGKEAPKGAEKRKTERKGKQQKEERDESQEGSEEVYKDEL